MQILLKHSQSGLLVNQAGGWTAKAREALSFQSTLAAREYCRKHVHHGTRLVVRFKNPRHDMELIHG
jgi:hypothetical protein